MKWTYVLISFMAILIFWAPSPARSADDGVPRITASELKAKMDKGEDIVIIDVRTGIEYARSEIKIKGAIRIDIFQLENRSKEIPIDKEIITYCT
jgi:rhodanese-related sulfurtransferase